MIACQQDQQFETCKTNDNFINKQYKMKLTSALSSQVQKTFPWKKFLIFQETKLSSSNIKKFYISANETLYFFDLNPQSFSLKKLLYFFLKKPALKRIIIFSQKKAFLIFPEMKTCTFHPKLKKYKKIHPMKISHTSGNGNSKKNVCVFSKVSCIGIPKL